MILKRVLRRLRAAWPETVIVMRGDSHFANPELMQLALEDSRVEFIFGLSANAVLSRLAQPLLAATRRRQLAASVSGRAQGRGHGPGR